MGLSGRLVKLKEKKLAQGELAKKVGIHPNITGRYERGETTPNIKMAVQLVDALGVSVDYLIGKLEKSILDKITSI
jgi:transcriptional regulator with XRE-family HTH domain